MLLIRKDESKWKRGRERIN